MAKVMAVYDGYSRKRLAYLQNAYAVGYVKNTTALWTGNFSLPYQDHKIKYCQAFNLVDMWDKDGNGNDRYVGLFRIMPRTEDAMSISPNVVYQLEHVLSTLLDDVMIGYHEIGNTEVTTSQVIADVLSRQSQEKWQLKECDYAYEFLYGWQNENLLSALFSIVQPFADTDYYWDFDTTAFPWQLSLKRTIKEPKLDIRYKKNLHGLNRHIDPTKLTTRLYCYGYGDGDNVLGISEVNEGLPYIDSPDSIKSQYGIITQIWTDERFTVAESLLAMGQAILKQLEEPAITYDLDVQTINTAGNLNIGDTVRIVSTGIDELMTVKNISKDDVTGAPQSGKIDLGQGTIDISSSLAELADRQRISETYSQGAESIFTIPFTDNADPDHPAEVTFIIPDNVIHVNEIRFYCNLTNFRAYSKAIAGGGVGDQTTLDGGSINQSTASGGGVSTTSESGGLVDTTSASGGSVVDSQIDIMNVRPNAENTDNLHNHGIGTDKWVVCNLSTNLVYNEEYSSYINEVTCEQINWVPSGDHIHKFSIPSHTHSVYQDAHTHNVVINSHTHDVVIDKHNHKYVIPNHEHNIEYGIYEGSSADTMTIYLDYDPDHPAETKVGEFEGSVSAVNLIEHMSKNTNGKIMRGKHTIRIVPNKLTRVECTLQIRLFTNMRGGEQY